MKKFLLLQLLVICSCVLIAQPHFSPAGDFTSAMNINLLEAKVNNVDLAAGDEIGVFDGNICVGRAILTEQLGELLDTKILACPVGADDPTTSQKDGYTQGNTIIFKFWDASENTEINLVEATFISSVDGSVINPSPTFEKDASVFVSLKTNFTPFETNFTVEDALCHNDSGLISFHVLSGGVPFEGGKYDFWLNANNEGRFSDFIRSAVNEEYVIMIEDSLGSRKFQDFVINEPDSMAFVAGHSLTNCGFDSAVIGIGSITGGTPPYQYWMVSDNPDFEGWTETYYSIMDTTGYLSPGDYYVRLFDANGCYADYINPNGGREIAIGTLSVRYTSGLSVCYSQFADMSIHVDYDITGHQIFYSADHGLTWQSSNEFSSLATGKSYWFGFRDETIDCTYFIEKEIITPDSLAAGSIYSTQVTCYNQSDGKIIVSDITGGNGSGWNIHVSGLDVFGNSVDKWYEAADQTTVELTNLAASDGNYSVTIFDNKGCGSSAYPIKVSQPSEIKYNVQVYNSSGDSCSDGRILLQNMEGGLSFNSGLYSVWINGNFYGKLDNFDSGSSLSPGSYEISLNDSSGCTTAINVEVGTNIVPVSLICIDDFISEGCQTQSQIDSLYENWLINSEISFEGGCNVDITYNYSEVPNACGGVATKTWYATDDNGTADSCMSSFIVTEYSPLVILEYPADTTVLSCSYSEREDLQIVFEKWIASTRNKILSSLSGGCDITIENNLDTIRINEVCINKKIIVSWVLYDNCSYESFDTEFILSAPLGDCPQHFHKVWEGTLGQDHMNINVFEVKIDGLELEPGDEIGIFDGELCVGYGKVGQTVDTLQILELVVSRDDGSGNGYTTGNNISYKLWDCSTSTEWPVRTVNYYDNQLNPVSPATFESGVTTFVELIAVSTVCIDPKFEEGWSIFSVNNFADPGDIKTLFQPLIDNGALIKIQDEQGNSLENLGIFGGWVNNIGDISPIKGYKINMNFDDSIKACGMPVKYPYAIPLVEGWNIAGYPQQTEVDGMAIVQQLIDRGSLIKVQDEAGNSIENLGIFGGWQNNIGNFVPGEGYKLKVFFDDFLLIEESYPKSTVVLPETVANTYFRPVYKGNGLDHMNINLVNLPANHLQTGDELAVFDGFSCVGAVTLLPHHLRKGTVSIAASAKDNHGMPGFDEGNEFTIKLWLANQDKEYLLVPDIMSGTIWFDKDESTIASLGKYINSGFGEMLEESNFNVKCYPNPFSEEITIEINLLNDSKVGVQVMNQLGQQVKNLAENVQMPKGIHRVTWNGKNSEFGMVSTGLYHLRVKIEEEVTYHKIVLTR